MYLGRWSDDTWVKVRIRKGERAMKRTFLLASLLILYFTVLGYGISMAGAPMDQIRETTDKIIAIVTDPALKGEQYKEQRRRLIRQVVDERFDWYEMAKRCLGRHWRKRTEEERAEFINLFEELLERTYLDRVEGYSGEKVLYLAEKVRGRHALVKVKILTKEGTEIPVIYRLKKNGERWMVYDIVIEGVSLVNNYRKQFSSILSRSSFQELLEKIRQKIKDKERQNEGGKGE